MSSLITGSHVLTGTIAWNRIVGDPSICALVWGVISMILLFFVALPPTFAEFAILGYIDFVSIIIAIGITIIATGIKAGDSGLGKDPLTTFASVEICSAPENLARPSRYLLTPCLMISRQCRLVTMATCGHDVPFSLSVDNKHYLRLLIRSLPVQLHG